MKLLLDTHIWLWYALGDAQLSDNLKVLISQADTELWVSPISLWEVMILAEKGKITLSDEPAKWIHQINLPHKDPADRFIAATALHHDLPLATVDAHLTAADWLPTIS